MPEDVSTQTANNADMDRSAHLSRSDKYFADNAEDSFMYAMTQEMEAVRLAYGYTISQFAQLLHIDKSTYFRAISEHKRISLPPLLAFCYIFGYDIAFLDEQVKARAKEDYAIQREIGALTAALAPKTLKRIKTSVVNYSGESTSKRRLYTMALDELIARKNGGQQASDDPE